MSVAQDGKINKAAKAAALTRASKIPADSKAYVEKIVGVKHHSSVSEFIVYTFHFKEISREVASIIGGRRLSSPMEQSQRHVKVGTGLAMTEYEKMAFTTYKTLLEKHKWKKEDARYVLPLSVKTTMMLTINRRSLGVLIERLYCSHSVEATKIADELVKIAAKDGIFETWGYDQEPALAAYEGHLDIEILESSKAYKLRGPRKDEYIDFVISDALSRSALDQMKRHRMASLIIDEFPQDSYYIPTGYRGGNKIYKQTIDLAREHEVIINATRFGFTQKINLRSFRNFVHLRTDPSAQTEIRGWTQGLYEELRDFVVKE
jgi:thymidylate synthase ThyX